MTLSKKGSFEKFGFNDIISTNQMTLVYSGDLEYRDGNVMIPLMTPFDYVSSYNLIISIMRKSGSKEQGHYFDIVRDTENKTAYSVTDNDFIDFYNTDIKGVAAAHADIELIVCGCRVPTLTEVTDITHESATINWTGASDSYYDIFIRTEADIAADTAVIFTTMGNSYTFEDLLPSTDYVYTIRRNCDAPLEVNSEWIDGRFTTHCQMPTDVAVRDITFHSANITWTAGTESAWELTYGENGFNHEAGEIVAVGVNDYTIEGLEPETLYDVYVRTICNDEYNSIWSEVVTFETLEEEPDEPEGIDGVKGDYQFTIYPNPTTGTTTITLTGVEGEVTINVVDMNGRTLITESVTCGSECEKRIDVEKLAQGTYFVRVLGDNVNSVRKLIVR